MSTLTIRLGSIFGIQRQALIEKPFAEVTPIAPQDRRMTDRSLDNVNVQLRIPGGEVLNGKALDLSDGGMRVRCGQKLQAGTTIAARLPLRDRHAEVRLRVKWSRRSGNGFEYGLESVPHPSQPMAHFWLYRRGLAA